MGFQIKTKRLIIRDIVKEDMPILLEQFAQPVARKNILTGQHETRFNRQKLNKAISQAAGSGPRHFYELAVTLKSDRTLIGSCSITNTFPQSEESFLGWHFDSRYWGNGYATEAARILLYIGFELKKVECINADCFADNRASIRVMEKIGMRPHSDNEPMNVIRGLFYGESRPTVRHSICRKDWLRRKNQGQ